MTRANIIAANVEAFVREVVIPYETDPRRDSHGPLDGLVYELREKAREAGVLTPHILPSGEHLTQRETATVLKKSGLSLLGPAACNTAAPDEGNMFLIGKVGSAAQKAHFLNPLVEGRTRSAFFMTEPAAEGGAGSDPSMMKTTARLNGNHWVINGRKAFITGYKGATVGIIMARTGTPERMAATMFLVDLPNPAITLERVLDTIDGSMPGGHSILNIENLRVSPARLSHCMRWHGAATRAQEIATAYACRREAFGKKLIDHEGVGFQLADNLIELKQAELMIDWCADVLDTGAPGTIESSMTKVAVSDALFRVADRCVQVMGGSGVSREHIVEQVFREIRAFRIYDGPTEVHKWSLAKMLKRENGKAHGK
jgi:acyl-CoA dehydrogenase